jgi:hypothetical protein
MEGDSENRMRESMGIVCTSQERTVTRTRGYKIVLGPPVVVAAGDIADCAREDDEATARLVEGIDGATVATLGDNAYPKGTDANFAECYEPSWGQFKARTMPSPGNHEYETPGASGYFDYFGTAAGDPGEGYYSYDLGS